MKLIKGQKIVIYFSLIEKYQAPVYSNTINKKRRKKSKILKKNKELYIFTAVLEIL